MACLSAYRRRPLPKENWTREDDERLKEAVIWWGENWQIGESNVLAGQLRSLAFTSRAGRMLGWKAAITR